MDLPNNLRAIRKSCPNKELRSGNKIAELMGISPQYYYDLETGRNRNRLNVDHLNKLTKIFNVTADEILGGQALPETSDQPKKPKDLLKILEQEDYTLNGRLASPEDKERLATIIEAMYWDAKKKNKRK